MTIEEAKHEIPTTESAISQLCGYCNPLGRYCCGENKCDKVALLKSISIEELQSLWAKYNGDMEYVLDTIQGLSEDKTSKTRCIDMMTEEELAKTIEAVNIDTGCCKGCVLGDLGERCLDGYADCGQAIAHYLLSPAEEGKK